MSFFPSSHHDPEEDLLGDDPLHTTSTTRRALTTAPVFTADALAALGEDTVPQRAVYGRVLAQKASGFPLHPQSPKLYVNTNTPFSAVVCGVQVDAVAVFGLLS